MFSELKPAPGDAIFGLNEQFLRDPNPDKINLTVGVYQNDQGHTPILQCIQSAQRQLLDREANKDYLPMGGLKDFTQAVTTLVLGDQHPAIAQRRVASIQTLGGTGALRLSADLLARSLGRRTIAHSDPTWPNHLGIFRAAGLSAQSYRYLRDDLQGIDFVGMTDDLSDLPVGTPVLLHTVCHNPTGFDIQPEQWDTLADLFADRHLIAVFDFAYQGFDRDVEQDREPIERFTQRGLPVFICNSFSKNMGLYGERVGGCTVVAENSDQADAILSHLKLHARCSYSNPPRHGASLAAIVLRDAQLYNEWIGELNGMRNRIDHCRELFLKVLRERVPDLDFEFFTRQRGMFGFSGLSSSQVKRLKDEFSIYILDNGRINIAGIRRQNVERLCDSIAAVSSPVRT